MQRDSFVFYGSFLKAIQQIKKRDIQAELALAIIEYGLTGEVAKCGEMVSIAMELIKPQIDANNLKYINGLKGAEHGSKGGRPPREKPQENPKETPEKPQENPKETPNEDVDVNENVNENEDVNDIPPNPLKGESAEKIDFKKLIAFLNRKTGRDFKVVNDSVKRKYSARLREGYTKEDILSAIENAVKDQFHKDNGFKYLTPEYFSRAATIDKHRTTAEPKEKPQAQTYTGNYLPGPWN